MVQRKVGMARLRRIATYFSYSTVVSEGGFVFFGLHRGFGDGIVAQFDDAFMNIANILTNFDLTLANIVKVNVRPMNIKDLPEMEERFNGYFEKDRFPARMTATTEFIDKDCLLMIDGVAYRKGNIYL